MRGGEGREREWEEGEGVGGRGGERREREWEGEGGGKGEKGSGRGKGGTLFQCLYMCAVRVCVPMRTCVFVPNKVWCFAVPCYDVW